MRRRTGSPMPGMAVAGMVALALALTSCSSGGGTEMTQKPGPTSAQASPAGPEPAGSSPVASASVVASAGLPDGAVVTYEFRDSSVPPPYHRSFVLTFNQQQARIVVDSYGEVLADKTTPMTPEAWDQVSSTIATIENLALEEPPIGCTGGTGFVVKVDSDGATVLDVDGYACGGVNGEASDEVVGWVAPVRSLFPPMSELAPDGLGG